MQLWKYSLSRLIRNLVSYAAFYCSGHIGAYGTTGTVEKKSNDVPMTKINNGNSYFGPDGKSIYASVSMKDKNNTSAPGGGVDNPKFVADSDGAYEPVVSITPKQSPAPKKKVNNYYESEVDGFVVYDQSSLLGVSPNTASYGTSSDSFSVLTRV